MGQQKTPFSGQANPLATPVHGMQGAMGRGQYPQQYGMQPGNGSWNLKFVEMTTISRKVKVLHLKDRLKDALAMSLVIASLSPCQ